MFLKKNKKVAGDEFKKGLNYAFLLLKYRARSCKEIKDRLRRKNFSPTIIQKVIDYLKERDYINDENFSLSYIQEKLKRGFSRRKISFDLKRLGVSTSIIENIFCRLGEDVDFKALQNLVPKLKKRGKSREQIFRYLVNRGFDYDKILKVLDENG